MDEHCCSKLRITNPEPRIIEYMVKDNEGHGFRNEENVNFIYVFAKLKHRRSYFIRKAVI